MKLTWRDSIATVLTATVVGLYWAYLADAGLPLVSGPRALAGATLIIGLGACIIGGGRMTADDTRSRYGRAMGAFAAVPGIAALIAIITGSEIALAVLVGSIVAMWFAATIHHMVTGPSEITDADLHQLIERDHVEQRPR